MARYFKEQDIDEFRECFYLFARSGQITSLDELTVVMRSLGMSPTIQELTGYLKGKGGRMSFADFLEVMHIHSRAENLPTEVVSAFKAADIDKKSIIPARQLRNLLQNWGEGLSARELNMAKLDIKNGFQAITHAITFQLQTTIKGRNLVLAQHVQDVKEIKSENNNKQILPKRSFTGKNIINL